MNNNHPSLGKTFRFIYLTTSGKSEPVAGTVTEIDAKTVTIRTDGGDVVTLDRSVIVDEQEVV